MNQSNTRYLIPNESSHRGQIQPIGEEVLNRPLWSVMIPTYNCAQYLRETLASVLAQAPGPEQMQIEVVDDCSTKDDPAAVVQEIGRGRVGFYRQPQNVGHTRNFATCLQRARGRLVHQLHGDDLVRDGFYASMEAAFKARPDIGAAFCRTIYAKQTGQWVAISGLERDEPGILENFAELLAAQQRIQTPSMVVRRSVYEQLGGFDNRLSWTEDWEMWVRVAANHPIWFEPAPLAVYRSHDNSSTERKILTAENIRDVGRCIAITSGYFPHKTGTRVRLAASRYYAKWCITTFACRLLIGGNQEAAWRHIIEALKLSRSWPVLYEVTKFLWLRLRIATAQLQRNMRS